MRYLFKWQNTKHHDVSCVTSTNTIVIGIHVDELTIKQYDIKGYIIQKNYNDRVISSYRTKNLVWLSYNNVPNKTYQFIITPYNQQNTTLKQFTLYFKVDTEAIRPEHQIYYNRALASSQSFAKKFPNFHKNNEQKYLVNPNEPAAKWLSNGYEESIHAFLDQATDSLDALYISTFELSSYNFIEKLTKLSNLGVQIFILMDKSMKNSDNGEIVKNILNTLHNVKMYSFDHLLHAKFIVYTRENKPTSLLVSSGNFSNDCFYGNFNISHQFFDEKISSIFFNVFQFLYSDPKNWSGVNQFNSKVQIGSSEINIKFLPDKEEFIQLCEDIKTSSKSLMITLPFQPSKELMKCLNQTREFGTYLILDKPLKKQETPLLNDIFVSHGDHLHEDQHHRWLPEHLTGLNEWVCYIHGKMMLLNAFHDQAMVVTGSYNFSMSGDQNFEIVMTIINDSYAEDIYFTQMLRMFNHYLVRDFNQPKKIKNILNYLDPTSPENYILSILFSSRIKYNST